MPKKQRHTAKKTWEILQSEGFAGGYTIVKDAVRHIKKISKEVFMPLSQRPGEAQVDFGHALANFNGTLKKVVLFVMSLSAFNQTKLLLVKKLLLCYYLDNC